MPRYTFRANYTLGRRLVLSTALLLALLIVMGGPALAQQGGPFEIEPGSPVRFVEGEDGAHQHYVVTPQGCVFVHGPVFFTPDKGHHLAAFASSGFVAVFLGGQDPAFLDPSRGTWHLDPCPPPD
jgi:hypothetical protein